MVTTLQVSLFKIYLFKFLCCSVLKGKKLVGVVLGGGGAEVNGNMKPGWQTNLCE